MSDSSSEYFSQFVVKYASCHISVLGGAIPGQEKCVWGPPYWCSHVTHARECGATTHCLQTVWKNQIIKPKSVSI